MLRTSVILLFLSTSFLVPLVAQERVQKKELTVPEALSSAGKAWEEKRFGDCVKVLRETLGQVSSAHSRAIRAAMPEAPEGFEKIAPRKEEDLANNPFAAALAGSVGSSVQQQYKGAKGKIECRVTANSPMIQMFSMWISNPAMLGNDSEVIKYGPHSAVLKTVGDGRSYELKILVNESLIEVDGQGISDDELLSFMSQAALDRLVSAL